MPVQVPHTEYGLTAKTDVQQHLVGISSMVADMAPSTFLCKGVSSCVILFLYHRHFGGVAHIQIPDSNSFRKGSFQDGTFADRAPAKLFEMLIEMGAPPERLKAKIIGGGNYFDWAESPNMSFLGRSNIENVVQAVMRMKVFITAVHHSGTYYNSVECFIPSGAVSIRHQNNQPITI